MKYGIYKFCTNDNKIIYIGKDSLITKQSRFRDHLKASRMYLSPINRYLNKNTDWYYEEIGHFKDKYVMNIIEKVLIQKHRPIYNTIFMKGGDTYGK